MNFQDEILLLSVVAQFCGAMATFAVGLAAFRVGRNQTKASLFEHRFAVYRRLTEALAEIASAGAVRDAPLDAIYQCLHAAKFLFGEDIYRDIEVIWVEANGARWVAPLEHRTRSLHEQEEERHHRAEIDRIWVALEPKMSKSLATWKD